MQNKTGKTLIVKMLGQFTCSIGNDLLEVDDIRSAKIGRILAYLLYHHDRNVPHSELIDLFLSDDLDNPYATLKNLVYRMRNIIADNLPGSDIIATSSGSYSISKEYSVDLDADSFQRDIKVLSTVGADQAQKERLYKEAVGLYAGDLLPRQSSEMWVIPLSTYLHTKFISVLKDYIYLLEAKSDYAEMNRMCSRGLQADYLDEELYYLNITSLVKQGNDAQALIQYHQATSTLFDELGDRPSDQMRELYREINKSHHAPELDISLVQDQLLANVVAKGAFYCEYGIFEEVYQVFVKWAQRYGMSIYLGLISAKTKTARSKERTEELIGSALAQLKSALMTNLRQGDVVTQYSSSQYLVLLPTCTQETSKSVMERVLMKYNDAGKVAGVDIGYTVSPIGIGQKAVISGENKK